MMKLRVISRISCALLLAAITAAAERPALAAPAEKAMDSRIDSRRIRDILELQRLKGLYFYNLDLKNWDAWRALFTKDTKLIVERNDAQGKHVDVVEGIDNMMAYVKERLAIPPSVHQGYTPLFEFTSDTEASGIWAMTGILFTGPDKVFYGYGHYRETYRKEGGVWKFSSVHLTRLSTDYLSRAAGGDRR